MFFLTGTGENYHDPTTEFVGRDGSYFLLKEPLLGKDTVKRTDQYCIFTQRSDKIQLRDLLYEKVFQSLEREASSIAH